MPDFSKYSNYNEDSSFSTVIFGANAPVLEVEQNELQQITDTKIRRLTEILGDTFFGGCAVGNSSNISDTGYVTIKKNSTIISREGFVAHIGEDVSFDIPLFSEESTPSIGDICLIYAHLQMVSLNYTSEIPKYGAVDGIDDSHPAGDITNEIEDSRVGAETTCRRQIQVKVESTTDSSIPENDSNNKYVLLGSCKITSLSPVTLDIKHTGKKYTYSELHDMVCFHNGELLSLGKYSYIPAYIKSGKLEFRVLPDKKGLTRVKSTLEVTGEPVIIVNTSGSTLYPISPYNVDSTSCSLRSDGSIQVEITFSGSSITEGYYLIFIDDNGTGDDYKVKVFTT